MPYPGLYRRRWACCGPGFLARLAHFHLGKVLLIFLINSLQFCVPGHKTGKTPVCGLLTPIQTSNNIVVVTEAFLAIFSLSITACPSRRTASVNQRVWTVYRILGALTGIAMSLTQFPICVEETRSNTACLGRVVRSQGLCLKWDLNQLFVVVVSFNL